MHYSNYNYSNSNVHKCTYKTYLHIFCLQGEGPLLSSCIQLAFLRMVLIKSEKGNGPLCHTINMNWNNWEGTHKYYDRAADSWQWCSKTIKNIKLSIYVFNWQQLKVTSKHRISYLLDGWCYIYISAIS